MFAWNYYFSSYDLFFKNYYMVMSLQNFKFFFIFVFNFQVVLIMIETSLVSTHFSGERYLTHYLHNTISTWIQFEKSIASWIHHINNKSIKAPGRHPFITIHHPPTLEASNWPDKNNCSYQNCTQLDSLPSELLHEIGLCNAGLVHGNKLKPVLFQLTKHHPVLRASTSYKLTYSPFGY